VTVTHLDLHLRVKGFYLKFSKTKFIDSNSLKNNSLQRFAIITTHQFSRLFGRTVQCPNPLLKPQQPNKPAKIEPNRQIKKRIETRQALTSTFRTSLKETKPGITSSTVQLYFYLL